MANFLDYCKQADADYDQFVDGGKGTRQQPLIWEQDGDFVVDRTTDTRFPLAEALVTVTHRVVDHMGNGVMVWSGEPNILIHFGTTGNA